MREDAVTYSRGQQVTTIGGREKQPILTDLLQQE